jgi:hypothetical protein
MSTYPEIYK